MRTLILFVAITLSLAAAPSLAACPKTTLGRAIVAAPPLLITSALSLTATGVGFVIDGTLFGVGPLASILLMCLPPTLLTGGLFDPCVEVVIPLAMELAIDTDLGPNIFSSTKSWRCFL